MEAWRGNEAARCWIYIDVDIRSREWVEAHIYVAWGLGDLLSMW